MGHAASDIKDRISKEWYPGLGLMRALETALANTYIRYYIDLSFASWAKELKIGLIELRSLLDHIVLPLVLSSGMRYRG